MISIPHSICARFEEQVAIDRDAVAVQAEDRRLTYGELNGAANRLARSIQLLAPDSVTVVVFTSHSASGLISLVGVLKSEKIFVPIDPRLPAARIRQILKDCEPQVVVADRETLARAHALEAPAIDILNADDLDPILSADNLRAPIGHDRPACLMYTSGSTGSPKGVVQTHRTLLNRISSYTELLRITRQDRVAMLAPCSVAQGLSSALQALLNGASVHPLDLQGAGVGALSEWLTAQKITVLVSTTGAFRHFANTLQPQERFPLVKVIRLGSEPMSRVEFDLFRDHFSPGCRLIGSLGSTETGPIALYEMHHATEVGDSVPAGYPLPGTSLTIVDSAGNALPAGQVGEIVVRSPFVASGYWRDPARTAAAFAGPARGGDRQFRTGDLGVLRDDGCLEHRGRKDFRVKVRGFRVELEDIERALAAHPLVSEAAVIVRAHAATDDVRLAAYVVTRDAGTTPDVLRVHLRAQLPDHMVPSTIDVVPVLPRTSSGKVDRMALPQITPVESTTVGTDSTLTDVVDMCVKHLWEDVIGHQPIGTTANFFDAGGNSLLAARLIAAYERTFRVKLPLTTFLSAPTIVQQAKLLRDRQLQREWPSLVPIRPGGTKPPLFCIHLVDGNVLGYRDIVRHLPSDQPVYGLQSRGLDRVSRINTRFEDMARDYVSEIRQFQPHGPYALCGWSFGGVLAYEMARQLEQQGESIALLAMLDSHVQAVPSSAGQVLSKVRKHAKALRNGKTTRAYVAKRFRNLRQVVENVVGRKMVLWQRRGYWVPRALQSVRQANKSARRDYVVKPYGGPVTHFTTKLPSGRSSYDERWQAFATGVTEFHEVGGTHESMVFEPHSRGLAAALARCLDRAWNGVAQPVTQPAGTASGDDRAA